MGINLNNLPNKIAGWNWLAFILGPLWYLMNGLFFKGSFLIITLIIAISLFPFEYIIPIVLIYCGLKGNRDLYEKRLANKSKSNTKRL